ncbi:50S ribosomal protein L29, chloroplastic [Heracleum sosnowskyi]|uniref:Large ribosomal subunit protein uL29c n=1 Tax=Heracleum sosnowskyi TaxID=360622 RepID=A0AAD8M4H0_9APIA|nr:50S ribosomal protein L29, chloroplastic [Heracleum sosnowskyi]
MLSSFSIATTSFSPFPRTLISKSSSFHGIKIAHVCLPRIQCTRAVQISPVKMSKKDEELKEIRSLSTEEIQEQVVDLKGELFMLRLQRSARNEFKSSDFRRMRKRVARMLTVRRERELEEGLNKRLSRKRDRLWKKSIVVRPPPSLIKLREEEAAEEAKESASS